MLIDEQLAMCADETIDLNLLCLGTAQPTCLLIHGLADGGFVWKHFARALSRKYSAAIVDLRGHGDTKWDPGRRYSVAAHTRDVSRVIDNLDPERLIIIGHSLGAQVGLRLARKYESRLRALVIVDFGPSLSLAGMDRARRNLHESLRVYDSVDAYAQWLRQTRPLTGEHVVEDLARDSLRPVNGGLSLKLDPEVITTDDRHSPAEEMLLWDIIHELRVPMLIVRGTGSAILTRVIAERMAHVAANAILANIVAGHAVMLDNPGDFEAKVLAFLDRVTRTEVHGNLQGERLNGAS